MSRLQSRKVALHVQGLGHDSNPSTFPCRSSAAVRRSRRSTDFTAPSGCAKADIFPKLPPKTLSFFFTPHKVDFKTLFFLQTYQTYFGFLWLKVNTLLHLLHSVLARVEKLFLLVVFFPFSLVEARRPTFQESHDERADWLRKRNLSKDHYG